MHRPSAGALSGRLIGFSSIKAISESEVREAILVPWTISDSLADSVVRKAHSAAAGGEIGNEREIVIVAGPGAAAGTAEGTGEDMESPKTRAEAR